VIHNVLYAGLGGGIGYAYYRLIGCRSGLCPLTSNPIISAAFGAILGLLLAKGAG
jgi:hypothetical protein